MSYILVILMHYTDFVPFQNVSFGVVVCLFLMRHIR